MAAYLLALISHEGAHMLVAKWLGCQTASMELTPFGAVAKIEDLEGQRYLHQVLIALAGPFSSFCGFLSSVLCLRLIAVAWYPLGLAMTKAHLFLLILNLLPVLPLDGGRVLFAALASSFGAERTARWLSNAGIWMGVAMTVFGLWAALQLHIYNLTIVLTGCYLAYAASCCSSALISQSIHALIDKRTKLEQKGILPVHEIAVSGHLTVRQVCQRMKPGIYYRAVVVDSLALEPLGQLEENQIQEALLTDMNMTLSSVIRLSKPAKKC